MARRGPRGQGVGKERPVPARHQGVWRRGCGRPFCPVSSGAGRLSAVGQRVAKAHRSARGRADGAQGAGQEVWFCKAKGMLSGGKTIPFARQKVCFRSLPVRAARFRTGRHSPAPRPFAPRHAPRPARAGEPRGGMEGLGAACGKRALKAQMGLCGQNRAKLRSNLSI